MPGLTCHDVAKYFLRRVDPDAGDAITNIKLQKLVYYAQGFGLAILDRPLFDEAIEAWEHGPVVPDLYHAYKDFGANSLPIPDDLDLNRFDPDELSLLDEVYTEYGQYSAWVLRNMTHVEAPWRDARARGASAAMTNQELKRFFSTLVFDTLAAFPLGSLGRNGTMDRFLSTKEAAERLGLSRSVVIHHARRGALPHVRTTIGRLFPASAIEAEAARRAERRGLQDRTEDRDPALVKAGK